MEDKKEARLIGRMLVNSGIISDQDLDKALEYQKQNGGFLASIIVKLKLAKEDEVFKVLAKQIGVSYINLKKVTVESEAIKKVPAKFALYYKLMPFAFKGNVLEVALVDPLNVQVLDDLKMLLNVDIRPYLASEESIVEAIHNSYGIGAGTFGTGKVSSGSKKTSEPAEKIRIESGGEEAAVEDSSIVNFVDELVNRAIDARATDIHLEPCENEIVARYRIDGILYKIPLPPGIKEFQSAIISRVKIMSNLNIAEKRLPQDGRILYKYKNNEYDLRISVIPTPSGESVNMRILSRSAILDLKDLGLLEEEQNILEKLILKPNGIIFVTGPTGSGKTTTLYACLQKLNTPERKIITIEDPVEYRIDGIDQIQVHPKIGLNFAEGLRAVLRHDPDVILIGEVRDIETAEIAIRSSLTGHLVFSTLHTNDAAGGVTRLLDMGIEPYLIASTVECIIAQRLVRVICDKCKEEVKATKEILQLFGVDERGDFTLYRGKGCEECFNTGYKGRTAIYEFLLVNDDIRDLILQRASARQIREKAMQLGMKSLKMDGWDKIKLGQTTAEEVLRVATE